MQAKSGRELVMELDGHHSRDMFRPILQEDKHENQFFPLHSFRNDRFTSLQTSHSLSCSKSLAEPKLSACLGRNGS